MYNFIHIYYDVCIYMQEMLVKAQAQVQKLGTFRYLYVYVCV
jgi:hypothetical protein